MEPLSLLDLLSNGYLLLATTPYLLPEELLALSRCSRSFHALVTQSPSVWRHVDLSAAPPSSTALSALGTAPRCHPAQLLRQPHVLRDVTTLVLDGLCSVTTMLLRELLCSTTTPQYRIRLLSIRRCPNLDLLQLSGLFRHLARPARERRLGELRGCYLFSDMDSTAHARPKQGRFVDRQILIDNDKTEHDWVATLRVCAGELAFDTRLCSGPRHSQYHDHNHDNNHSHNHSHSHHADAHENPAPAHTPSPDRIACVRLTGGCAVCHSSPEARQRRKAPGQGPSHELPPVVVAPVPLTTSSLRAACSVPGYDGHDDGARQDVLRCETCVANRMCNKCDRWWCETCVDPDQAADKKYVSLDCYDCGNLCRDCTAISSRICSSCRGQYCVDHNDGADNEWCEWCNSPERRLIGSEYAQQRCVRTLARLNQIRNTFGFGGHRGSKLSEALPIGDRIGGIARSRFQDEVIVRNRCLVSL